MSSADTRDLATARGSFPVCSFATFAALKDFCAASLYTIAYSHRLRPVFQTFCLTSSPYLLELFFFRKRRQRRLRVPFYKRDVALKSRNIAEDVAGLRVITLSVPHHRAHFNVTMKKKVPFAVRCKSFANSYLSPSPFLHPIRSSRSCVLNNEFLPLIIRRFFFLKMLQPVMLESVVFQECC